MESWAQDIIDPPGASSEKFQKIRRAQGRAARATAKRACQQMLSGAPPAILQFH